MNVKILVISVLIATVFLSVSFFVVPEAQPIPTNRVQCNTCHASGGVGTLSATYFDGTKPENSIFTITPGETLGISLYGIGAQDQNEPAVSLIFDSQILHHLTITGALAGGEGSYSYYVRDGDENDQDSDVSNVKGSFQITADANTPAGEFQLIGVYEQAGPTGVNVNLVLKVEGVARESSSISLLVSPQEVYANSGVVFISGGIRPSDADSVNIQIQSGEEWKTIAAVRPGRDGNFFYEWSPSTIEEYNVRVLFEGTKNIEPAESQIFTIAVEKAPDTFINQITTAIGLGLLIILIGLGLFYWAGRGRYNRQVGVKV
jgi:hypothetical protein